MSVGRAPGVCVIGRPCRYGNCSTSGWRCASTNPSRWPWCWVFLCHGVTGEGCAAFARSVAGVDADTACQASDFGDLLNGIDPGFSGDTLVYTALSLAGRATAVTVQEIRDYASYDDAEFTGVSFGFGTQPEHEPILFVPGVLASMWGIQSASRESGTARS